jgi:hypothetical protein
MYISCMEYTRIPNRPQVAITLGYRYQPPARAPIDAGKWCQVMEKERVIATRLGAALGRTAEHVNNVSGSE